MVGAVSTLDALAAQPAAEADQGMAGMDAQGERPPSVAIGIATSGNLGPCALDDSVAEPVEACPPQLSLEGRVRQDHGSSQFLGFDGDS